MEKTESQRKVFWLLKRSTSYSLWRRKRDAWAEFVSAYEHAIKHWSSSDLAHLDVDLLPLAYDALSSYNEGLSNLARGYRFVWRAGQAVHEAQHKSGTVFANFYRQPDYWERGAQLRMASGNQ
jgi:hypothetical protein